MSIKTGTERREVRLDVSSTHPPRSASRSAEHCETRRARVYKASAIFGRWGMTGLSFANRKLSPQRPFPSCASRCRWCSSRAIDVWMFTLCDTKYHCVLELIDLMDAVFEVPRSTACSD